MVRGTENSFREQRLILCLEARSYTIRLQTLFSKKLITAFLRFSLMQNETRPLNRQLYVGKYVRSTFCVYLTTFLDEKYESCVTSLTLIIM